MGEVVVVVENGGNNKVLRYIKWRALVVSDRVELRARWADRIEL